MTPLWPPVARSADDMESLQTDVMRFMAILGLCLAAIFSLVQSAEPTPAPAQRAAEPEITTSGATADLPGRPVADTGVEATQVPPAFADAPAQAPLDPPPPASETGFTLEFGSDQALLSLLQGQQVRLYRSDGEQFWQVLASGEQQLTSPPASYYQMDKSTVPKALRGDDRSSLWGVVLDSSMVARLEQILGRHKGGHLVIDGTGKLAIE